MIAQLKWNWAGHCKMSENRWTKHPERQPRQDTYRNWGRSLTKLIDDIKPVSSNWIYIIQDRDK